MRRPQGRCGTKNIVDLLPGLAEKTAAPEDLLRSPLPHTAYLLVRRKIALATGTAMRRVRVGLKRALRSRPRGKEEQ